MISCYSLNQTRKKWKAELTLDLPSGFEPGILVYWYSSTLTTRPLKQVKGDLH